MTARHRLPPHQRAMARQRSELRKSMHDWVEVIFDAWPDIDEAARSMGGGYPSSDLGTLGGGDEGGRTASLAVAHLERPRFDPAQAASDWEAERIEAFAHMRRLAGKAVALRPLTAELVERIRTDGEVALCIGCKLPAPSGRDLSTGQPTLAIDKYGRPWHPECMPADVDRCTECGDLASETEFVRQDGRVVAIVHARELGTGCFWRAYNRIKGRRAARSEGA